MLGTAGKGGAQPADEHTVAHLEEGISRTHCTLVKHIRDLICDGGEGQGRVGTRQAGNCARYKRGMAWPVHACARHALTDSDGNRMAEFTAETQVWR